MKKNKITKIKIQEEKLKDLYEKYPWSFGIFFHKDYSYVIKSIILVLLFLGLLYIAGNKRNVFTSKTDKLFVYIKKGEYYFYLYDKELKKEYDIPLKNIEKLDSEVLNKYFLYNMNKNSIFFNFKGVKLGFFNGKSSIDSIREDIDIIIFNYIENDTSYLNKLLKHTNYYLAFFIKKPNLLKDRKYYVYPEKIKKDQLIYGDKHIFIVIKQKPFGLKILDFSRR